MASRFRFTRTELERAQDLIQTGKLFGCSKAIERELIDAAVLKENYPFRKE
jgi:hypothetical protein